MDRNEMLLENCRATWREEARARAMEDLKGEGRYGDEEFFQERMQHHYSALEELGMENLTN